MRTTALVAVALLTWCSARAAGPTLRELPVLDRAKGQAAAAAYQRSLQALCKSQPAANELKRLRIDQDAFPDLCRISESPQPLASGAFVEPGADEVLLAVSSGESHAAGDHAVALMRRRDADYRLVGHLFKGEVFTARLRIGTSGRDALAMCEQGGGMGFYVGTCGFFGQGDFVPDGDEPRGANAIEIGVVTNCGPGSSVEITRAGVKDDRVRFTAKAERYVLSRRAKDEGECTARRVTRSSTHTVEYRFDGGRFTLTAPLPKAIKEAVPKG